MRVTVAVDPFLFRSTLHAALARDPRFDPRLCPVDEDPMAFATFNRSQILLQSDPAGGDTNCIVVVAIPTQANDRRPAQTVRQQIALNGLTDLLEALAATGASLVKKTQTC